MSDPIKIESATIVLRMADGTTKTIDVHKGGHIEAEIVHQNEFDPMWRELPVEYRLQHPQKATERKYRFGLTVVADRLADYSASDGNVYTVTDSTLATEAAQS